jgi:hypothetical protein
MNDSLILNLTKDLSVKLQRDKSYKQKVVNSHLRIGSYINPIDYDLDTNYTYRITGASSIEGCKYCSHVNTINSKKIYMPYRNKVKKRRVLGNILTQKVKAIDLKVTLNKKSEN